jgi:hypothetical protein
MIQIELKPEIEAQLLAEAKAKGMEPSVYAANIIESAYAHRYRMSRLSRNPAEIRVWLDSLTQFSDKIPQLPEEAFTRESFYQD